MWGGNRESRMSTISPASSVGAYIATQRQIAGEATLIGAGNERGR